MGGIQDTRLRSITSSLRKLNNNRHEFHEFSKTKDNEDIMLMLKLKKKVHRRERLKEFLATDEH